MNIKHTTQDALNLTVKGITYISNSKYYPPIKSSLLHLPDEVVGQGEQSSMYTSKQALPSTSKSAAMGKSKPEQKLTGVYPEGDDHSDNLTTKS